MLQSPCLDAATDVWRRLSAAVAAPDHPLRLLTLATTDRANRPAARLMVLRRVNADRRELWMHTDRHSAKVKQIQHNPHVVIVGFDPSDGVEIRLSGQAAIVAGDALTQGHWLEIWRAMMTAEILAAGGEDKLDLRTISNVSGADPELYSRMRDDAAIITVTVNAIEWLQAKDSECMRVCAHRDADWEPRLLPIF